MSTHSRIGVQQNDGTIISIYCHFDGYIDGVGKTLCYEHHGFEKAMNLVLLGNCSSICGGLVAYRELDWAWDDVKPKVHKAIDDFESYFESYFESVNYLFVDGVWKFWYKPNWKIIEYYKNIMNNK